MIDVPAFNHREIHRMSFWQLLLSWLLPVVETEVQTILPIATNAVSTLTTEESAALASGDLKNTGKILATVVKNAADQAAAQGLSVGAPALLTAVGHAVQSATGASGAAVSAAAADKPSPSDDGSGHPGLVRSA